MAGLGLGFWFLIAIVVTGVYVLPSVVATFSGSHTMEYNASAQVGGLECQNCHTYITDEINSTLSAWNVLEAHMAAAGNTNYVNTSDSTASRVLNITNVDNSTITGACQICHLMEQDALSIGGVHTKITIRACTDIDCHGNSSANTGTDVYLDAGNVGRNISNSADAHSGWYNAMEGQTSSLEREDGGNYKAGYYACMACHTHLEMNMNLSRPKAFNINITINSSGTFIAGPTVNYTQPNETTSQRVYGSMWP